MLVDEGTVKLSIPDLSSFPGRADSTISYIGGFPWFLFTLFFFFFCNFLRFVCTSPSFCCRHLYVQSECSEDTDNVKCLGVYVCCNEESKSNLWSCNARIELRLVSQKEGVSDHTASVRTTHCPNIFSIPG